MVLTLLHFSFCLVTRSIAIAHDSDWNTTGQDRECYFPICLKCFIVLKCYNREYTVHVIFSARNFFGMQWREFCLPCCLLAGCDRSSWKVISTSIHPVQWQIWMFILWGRRGSCTSGKGSFKMLSIYHWPTKTSKAERKSSWARPTSSTGWIYGRIKQWLRMNMKCLWLFILDTFIKYLCFLYHYFHFLNLTNV